MEKLRLENMTLCQRVNIQFDIKEKISKEILMSKLIIGHSLDLFSYEGIGN